MCANSEKKILHFIVSIWKFRRHRLQVAHEEMREWFSNSSWPTGNSLRSSCFIGVMGWCRVLGQLGGHSSGFCPGSSHHHCSAQQNTASGGLTQGIGHNFLRYFMFLYAHCFLFNSNKFWMWGGAVRLCYLTALEGWYGPWNLLKVTRGLLYIKPPMHLWFMRPCA